MSSPLLFFPDRPDLDVQIMRLAAEAMHGGADVFECLETSAKIRAAGETEESWREHWSALGYKLMADSESAAAVSGQSAVSAGQAAARACNYFRTAEFFAPFDSEARKELFNASRNAFKRSIPQLRVEVSEIAVPDGEVSYDGYVFHGRGATASEPGPGVVLLGGADSYAEEQFFFGGCALAERGITVLVADTPGRGSTLRHKGILSRPDYEHPASRVLDALEGLPQVDANRLGVVGVSLGGYYGPRLAAFDDRVRACVCWCACFNVLEDVYEFFEPIQAQLRWIVGASTDAEARERLAEFRLDDVAGNITCPTLISHGAGDTIIAARSAQRLYDALGASDKHLRIWSADEGGAVHCNYDAWNQCMPFMFDWLDERLSGPVA